MAGKLVSIGRIVRPHGNRGEVKATLFDRHSTNIRTGEVFLVGPDGTVAKSEVFSVRGCPGSAVVGLKGVESREEAGKLRRFEIAVERDRLPEPAEGEYYCADIVGMEIVDRSGRTVGRVEAVSSNNAQDVLVCRGETGEFMIPLVKRIVLEIDLKRGRLVADLPEGLF